MSKRTEKQIADDEAIHTCAKNLLADEAEKELVLRVPITDERARRWLRERNALGRIVATLIGGDEGEKLEDLSDELAHAREDIERIEREIDKVGHELRLRHETIYEVISTVLGDAYTTEGHNPLTEEDASHFVAPEHETPAT